MLVLLIPIGISAQENSMTVVQSALYDIGFDIPKGAIEAPEFSLKSLEGGEASLEAASGKLLLLNIWATWCPPCRAEMPSMQSLYDQLSDKGFELYAVAAPNPPRETREKIVDYIEENSYTFPVPIDEEFVVNSLYGTGSIPTSWLIGPDGMVIARLVGATEWDSPELIAALRKALPEE